jgi:hypothetical protein
MGLVSTQQLMLAPTGARTMAQYATKAPKPKSGNQPTIVQNSRFKVGVGWSGGKYAAASAFWFL